MQSSLVGGLGGWGAASSRLKRDRSPLPSLCTLTPAWEHSLVPEAVAKGHIKISPACAVAIPCGRRGAGSQGVG